MVSACHEIQAHVILLIHCSCLVLCMCQFIHALLSPKTYPKRVRAIKTHKVMADDDSLSFGAGDIIFVIEK